MTNKQKRELANAVRETIQSALLSNWDAQVEEFYPTLKGVGSEEAARQIGKWLKEMPDSQKAED